MSRNTKGEPTALVVDEAGTVKQRMLTLDRTVGDRWLVLSGLSAGERLIVEGALKVRPGATVKVVPLDNRKAGAQAPNINGPPAESN